MTNQRKNLSTTLQSLNGLTRKFSILVVLAIAASSLLGVTHATALSIAAPAAPTNVSSHPGSGGIVVRWNPVTATPPVTSYIVSAGPGSCPIVVPASTQNLVANLPVLATQTTIQPYVQAVSNYGFSTKGLAPEIYTGTSRSALSTTTGVKAVQLLELSDFHGAIEATSSQIGAATFKAAWDKDRTANPATFALSAGDNIGAAPPISAFFDEISTIKSLNAMGLDASTFGNHEHDKDITALQKVIGASTFKWVVSNYSTLAPIKGGDNQAVSFTVLDKGGFKLGIVGMNVGETPYVTKPGNLDYIDSNGVKKTITITDGVKELNAGIVAAKAAGADIVVALLHNGFVDYNGTDINAPAEGPLLDIAAKLKGAAVIFGGHTHLQYATLTPNRLSQPAGALLGQVVNAGTSYNRVQVCINSTSKKVLGSSLELVTKNDVKGLTPDSATAALVADYKSKLGASVDVKIGQVSALFPAGNYAGSGLKIQRQKEIELGDYIADAMRARYKTDFAITNGGGIRDSLPASGYPPLNTSYVRPKVFNAPDTSVSGPFDITYGDALAVLPFGNFAVTTSLTGSDIWKALENGARGYANGDGWFPQISGLRFTFDPTRSAQGLVTAVTKSDGTPVAKDDKVYSIVTNDYMLYGGDGYTMFNPTKGSIRDLLVDVLADALKSDMAAGKVTQLPKLDGRITRVGA
jgi:2',3'-cyclic-nucleotide 2'-phosphodiesterase (5'-nucleotidase family)